MTIESGNSPRGNSVAKMDRACREANRLVVGRASCSRALA